VGRVIIGVDPHKLSATIEVLDQWENVLGRGRFGTDRDGYRQMLTVGRRWPERAWAVEGCNGIGRHVAQRLVADGETVLDVPAKLSARARCSQPAMAARPTPPTRTRSRSSPCAHPA
jgi:transposase